MYKRLKDNSIPRNKIILIPIGVDNSFFKPANKQKKLIARSNLNISKNEIVIGSFQKDGEGWDDGKTPKLIKGPDIFLKVVENLKEEFHKSYFNRSCKRLCEGWIKGNERTFCT